MSKRLYKYNNKRDFKKTSEPIGKINKKGKKLRFVVQHHLARRDHYDLRLEWDGVLKSWAVPKGPSYNPNDKRLAVQVEDHPLDYRNFEGLIPKGQYGAGPVMIWDYGFYEFITDADFENGPIKFILKGKRLKGKWSLVRFKDDNWLLIKDADEYFEYDNINKYDTSVKTNRTMDEIMNNKIIITESKVREVLGIPISSPDKIISLKPKVTKLDIAKYYAVVSDKMMPYIKNRIISVIRNPDGAGGEKFYKKHLDTKSSGIRNIDLKSDKDADNDYYYIINANGLINEVQMNSFEFHIWGSTVKSLERPDMMVFDLDPDEGMNLRKIRGGVKDLKKVLDEFGVNSFVKTSGGKGYHVVVPFQKKYSWDEFRNIAKNIAKLMESRWPNKYTTNIRKEKRKGKIFVDWIRNTRSATSVAPYSIRLRDKITVSMPISYDDVDKIKPDEITIKKAIEMIKIKDPWKDFFQYMKDEL